MAKGQKAIQEDATKKSNEQYAVGQAAQKRLVDGSPEFQARKASVAERRKAIDTGNIADAKDFISNRTAIAERVRQREARGNLAKSGVAGLSSNYTDPNQIALAKQLQDDEFSRDSAAQQETDAKEYMAETSAMENDIINAEANADATVANQAFGISQNQQNLAAQISAQRASVVPSIIGMGLGTFGSVASGAGWFKPKTTAPSAPTGGG